MSNSFLDDLKAEPDDLIVVPEGTKIPENFKCLIYPMKFLYKPSIIRSRGYSAMGFLEHFSLSKLASYLGGKTETGPSLRDLMEAEGYSDILIRDSEIKTTTNPVISEKSEETAGKSFVDAVAEKFTAKSEKLPRVWRYIRTKGKNQSVGPKGGVTFYIELNAPEKTFAFSYSLCHTNENFNSKIARAITKQRFENEDWYEVKNYDPAFGLVENIGEALFNALYNPNVDESTGTVFSSLSERVNYSELKKIYERI